MGWRGLLVLLVLGFGAAAPAAADAAVTFGSALPAPTPGHYDSCTNICTAAMVELPGAQTRSPTDGTIVRFRLRTAAGSDPEQVRFRVLHPERGDVSRRRARATAGRVCAAERALYGPGSWRRHIDEASAVDFALVSELFKNQDAFHASTYVELDRGKLRLGPVWDFDISSGNSDYGASRRLRGWMLSRRDWAERLYRDRRSRAAWPRAGPSCAGAGSAATYSRRSTATSSRCMARSRAISPAGRCWTGASGPTRAPAEATGRRRASCARG